MRVLAAYVSLERQISITEMAKQKEKKQYNNTKFIVLKSWLGVLLAAPGVRIGGGPPAAGGWSPCSWIITPFVWSSGYRTLVAYRLLRIDFVLEKISLI